MHDYILLVSESTGLHLCDGADESGLGLRTHCDDSCVWEWDGDSSLRNAATGAMVKVEQCGERPGPEQAAEIDAKFGGIFAPNSVIHQSRRCTRCLIHHRI